MNAQLVEPSADPPVSPERVLIRAWAWERSDGIDPKIIDYDLSQLLQGLLCLHRNLEQDGVAVARYYEEFAKLGQECMQIHHYLLLSDDRNEKLAHAVMEAASHRLARTGLDPQAKTREPAVPS